MPIKPSLAVFINIIESIDLIKLINEKVKNYRCSLNISFNFNQIMVWLGPFLTLMVLMNLPSALSLYWFISSLVSIGQQIYINKKLRLEKNEGSFDSKN